MQNGKNIITLSEEEILNELLNRADDWLWQLAITYKGRPHSPLILNREWQNCGLKQSYIGKFGFYSDGKAFVQLTYHNFKHGGIKEKFRCNEVRREILSSHKAGKVYKRVSKTIDEEQQPTKISREELLKDFLMQEHELWNDGVNNLSYVHDYWKKKGFKENIVDSSIRYVCINANKYSAYPTIAIMVKITGIDGNLKGYQKIYSDGSKEFTTTMSKKDNFIILGTDGLLPEKLKEVFTTEGLATGVSVKQALDNKIPVIATLDAGNIEPVISAIRTKYGSKSKCAITICADDDRWKALEVDPVTRKAVGNTGLSKAHPVALRYRCKIVSPDFVGLDNSTFPKDFDDLRQLAGIEEVSYQLGLAKRPNLDFAITEESLIEERKRIWGNFFGNKIISINQRYVSDMVADEEEGNVRNLQELILTHRVSLLKCPIGTGKTTIVAKTIKGLEHHSVAYITYLTGLNRQGAKQFDLEDYTQYQGYNGAECAKLTELPKLSICLNSLFKLLDKNARLVRKIDIVIIDEIQQVIRRLSSNIKNKIEVISALKQLVQSAKHLILMDAHIDRVTLELLKEWLPGEKAFVLLNEYQAGVGRNILLYQQEGMILDKALEALKAGQRAFIVTNNRKLAWEIFYKLKETTGKRGLAVTGMNPGDKEVEKFFLNVNEEVLNYDFIVASPSITSGISIDEDVFGFVGGVFTHATNTPMDCLQALGRVRKADRFHVYVSETKQVLPVTDEEISAKWTHTHKYDENLLPFEQLFNDRLIEVAQDYKKICVSATKEANFAKQDFLSKFIKLCRMDGYNIYYAGATEQELEQAKFLEADAKDLENIKYIEMCANAKKSDDEEYEKLKEKPRKTLEETFQLKKKEIEDFYVLEQDAPKEVVEQVIMEDKRGKTRKEIKNLELALASDAEIQRMREEEQKQGIVLEPDKRDFAVEREVYRKILGVVGLNGELIADESRYSAETLRKTFLPWFLSNYMEMKGIFKRLATPKQIENDPVRVLGTLLKRLGLSHHRPGKHGAEYTINLAQLEKQKEIVIKRGKLLIKTTKGADAANNIINTAPALL